MTCNHLGSLVGFNGLSSQPLVKDVHHLAAQVDEEEGQRPLGHDEDTGRSAEGRVEVCLNQSRVRPGTESCLVESLPR